MQEQTDKQLLAPSQPDAATMAALIRSNLRVSLVPLVPEIRLYTAHPGSGLRRMLETRGADAQTPPYWAYPWAGGMPLARYLLDNPGIAANRTVLDLGAGSGLVGIAATMAGARAVTAAETDRNALAAIGLNAELNGVPLGVTTNDLLAGPPPDVDLIVAGDLFYDAELTHRVTVFLDRCLEAGIDILIGDPGRAFLPRDRLRLLAEYEVPDFGAARSGEGGPGFAFAFQPKA